MNMKKGDSVRLDDGRLLRVVFADSTMRRGCFTAHVVDDFNGQEGVVWGYFKKRSGVWVRFNPYA